MSKQLISKHRNQLEFIAHSLVTQAAKITQKDRVLIWFDEPAEDFSNHVAEECKKLGASIHFFKRQLEKRVQNARGMELEHIPSLFEEEERAMNECDIVILLRGPQNPAVLDLLPEDKYRMVQSLVEEIHRPRVEGTLRWTLFYWPTEYEATQEGKTYEAYFAEYMDACIAPWDTITQAQQYLKEVLDTGEVLELYANHEDPDPSRRTYVKMSIAGMTFCNSTIDNNYPGSEVFSAPVLESVEGHIFANGTYEYQGKRMKNISLDITGGQIQTTSFAEEGNEGLQEILALGSGARFFGEVALGTNPYLTRRWFNALMNEKVGGSFHMAIGHCYTFDQYNGIPVRLNNGNTPEKTTVHWDLTILMKKEYGGGKVVVDGKVIQKDGLFIDPRLQPLNETNA